MCALFGCSHISGYIKLSLISVFRKRKFWVNSLKISYPELLEPGVSFFLIAEMGVKGSTVWFNFANFAGVGGIVSEANFLFFAEFEICKSSKSVLHSRPVKFIWR